MLTVYSKDQCQQCVTAVGILKEKGIPFRALKLGVDYSKEQLMAIAPTARTLPQITDGDVLIGGLKELQEYLAAV